MSLNIYLASPYSSGMPEGISERYRNQLLGERYNKAIDACAWLSNNLYIVYSPIVHWHPVAKKHKLKLHYTHWEAQDNAMLEWSTSVYVLTIPGWNTSEGIHKEIEKAVARNKYIWYIRRQSKTHRFINKVQKYKITKEPFGNV